MDTDIFIYETLEKIRDRLLPIIESDGYAVVTTIVDGHHGSHIPDVLFDIVKDNVCKPGDEWVYDRVDEVIESLADRLREHFDDDKWWVGWNEADGSIDVFYGEEKEEV